MTIKLMYALWGPDPVALHAGALRLALAIHGVTRLQVDVDDDHAGAEGRVGAVLTAWLPEERRALVAEVTSALRHCAEQVVGWEVEERRPVDPPEAPDGARTTTTLLRGTQEVEGGGRVLNVVLAPVTPLPDGLAPVTALVEEVVPAGEPDLDGDVLERVSTSRHLYSLEHAVDRTSTPSP